MEVEKDTLGMLDLMIRPGFCVKENKIVKVNQAAESFLLIPGTDVKDLLLTGQEEYREFTGGCLYLTLSLAGHSVSASVTRLDDTDVFVIEQDADERELRSMALAAQGLREPLANVMATANGLFPLCTAQEDPQTQKQVARMNRGLFQILRVIGNMSDASRYAASSRQETLAIASEFDEIFEKAQAAIAHTGIRLRYTGLQESLYCLGDKEQLERAVLNILSNALKFTEKNGTIDATLTHRGRMLRLSVQDDGSGISDSVRANIFHRHLRQPGIEDGRFGLGLGMVLIRSVAANHGGTVLIDQPEGQGTRITMTMALRQNSGNVLRCPVPRVDYAGGYDHTLLELSDCLPASVYEKEI